MRTTTYFNPPPGDAVLREIQRKFRSTGDLTLLKQWALEAIRAFGDVPGRLSAETGREHVTALGKGSPWEHLSPLLTGDRVRILRQAHAEAEPSVVDTVVSGPPYQIKTPAAASPRWSLSQEAVAAFAGQLFFSVSLYGGGSLAFSPTDLFYMEQSLVYASAPQDVLAIELLPSAETVMRQLKQGDRIMVRFGSGAERVLDVTGARLSPHATKDGKRSYHVYTSGRGMGGGSIFQWPGDKVQFQASLNQSPEPVWSIDLVAPDYKKPRRKTDPETRAIRLGTRRAEAIFRSIVAGKVYHYVDDGMGYTDPNSQLDVEWARQNLHKDAMTHRARLTQGSLGHYHLSYHSNHWVDFTTAAATDAAQAATLEVQGPEYVEYPEEPWEFPLSEGAAFAPPPPPPPESEPWDVPVSAGAPWAPPPPEILVVEPPPGPVLIGRQDYQERLEDRRDRLERAAARARGEAAAQFRRADPREEASGIPFGQPILVGHHSERRHRRAVERMDAAMRRSIEADEAAQGYARAAERVGSAGVSSDDPAALVALRDQLRGLEAQRDRMKTVNLLIRKAAKAAGIDLKKLGTREYAGQREAGQGSHEQAAAVLTKAQELGVTPSEAAMIAKTFRIAPYNGLGYPGYALTNLGANMRRIQQRIESLEREGRSRAELVATTGTEAPEEQFGQVRVVQNTAANRVQLFFPGKPSEAHRSLLKSAGFRWSPREGAWQRMLNEQGRRAARRVAQEIGGTDVATNPQRVLKFAQPLDPGDEDLRFVVLEDRGDRVLVHEITSFGDWPTPPTFVYLKSDLMPAARSRRSKRNSKRGKRNPKRRKAKKSR